MSSNATWLLWLTYPQPGLFGKFYDQDMRPLVEVVRDTVGRHDTLALACNAKYYEDMGYPGHVNCTDNFNGQLDRYGIAPRRGIHSLSREIHAVPVEAGLASESAEVKTITATGIEDDVVRGCGHQLRDPVEKRLGDPAIVQSPPRRDGRCRVAWLL